MNNPNQSPITPYLNPAYWDGKMIGQADLDPVTRSYAFRQGIKADREVENYLDHHEAPFPQQIFEEGDVIDATMHAPGTLFYTNREELRARGEPSGELLAQARFTLLPSPPADLGFELLDFTGFASLMHNAERRRQVIMQDNLMYVARRSFLVVMKGSKGKHTFQPVDENNLFNMTDGHAHAVSAVAPIDSPFVVGKTTHTKISKSELLHRVNAVMLTKEGSPKKGRRSLNERFGEISLKPAIQPPIW